MVFFTRSTASILLLGATVALAQSEKPLPESCKTALLNIALNPEASSCLNTPVIMNTVLDIKQAGIDPVATLNTYISGMCNSGMCSNQTLTDIVKNVTAGCSGYALDYGFDIAGEAMGLNIALTLDAYPTARNVACLKETSTDGFCAVSTFNRSILDYAIDSDNSISGLYQTLMDAYVRGITPAKIERSCTPCTKAAWSLVRNASSELREENDGNIARVCGANFTDGVMPQTVVQAKLATQSKSSTLSLSTSNGLQIVAVGFMAVLGLML